MTGRNTTSLEECLNNAASYVGKTKEALEAKM